MGQDGMGWGWSVCVGGRSPVSSMKAEPPSSSRFPDPGSGRASGLPPCLGSRPVLTALGEGLWVLLPAQLLPLLTQELMAPARGTGSPSLCCPGDMFVRDLQ